MVVNICFLLHSLRVWGEDESNTTEGNHWENNLPRISDTHYYYRYRMSFLAGFPRQAINNSF